MSEAEIFRRYRLFIFDADDTLRRTTVPGQPCPRRQDQWILLPGVRRKLADVRWNQRGYPVLGIASNQDQVGYGHLSFETARGLLRDLARSAARVEPPDAALQLCPHTLELDCGCRKPAPGMLLAIMTHYGMGPQQTVFVGDQAVDRAAAARAGCAFIWAAEFFDWSQSNAPTLAKAQQV
jgi:D-glycero-D-manno-heptose 1,7-bisphosphate phosphatase